MTKFIELINGKKTAIGFIVLFVEGIIRSFFDGASWAMPDYLLGICAALNYLGYGLGGIGVADKFRKGELSIPSQNVSGFDISHQYPAEPVPYVLTTSMDENKKS